MADTEVTIRQRALRQSSSEIQQILDNSPSYEALGFPAFSEQQAYAVGDKVYHEHKLYEFTAPHPAGTWDAQHVTQTSIKGFVGNVITDTEMADVLA